MINVRLSHICIHICINLEYLTPMFLFINTYQVLSKSPLVMHHYVTDILKSAFIKTFFSYIWSKAYT